MRSAFRHLLPLGRNATSLAAAVLVLVLPLATPAVAGSVLEVGTEREATITDSMELLAWANDSRMASRRVRTSFVRPHSPLSALPCQKPWHPACYSHCLTGHRLACGIMAPLRC